MSWQRRLLVSREDERAHTFSALRVGPRIVVVPRQVTRLPEPVNLNEAPFGGVY